MSEHEPMDQHLSEGAQHLLEEVRAGNPRIDWSRVEARLFDQNGAVRDDLGGRVVRGRFGVAQIAAGLAIAASFTLAFWSPSRQTKEPVQRVAIDRAPVVEGNGAGRRVLHVGEVLEVGTQGDVLRAEGRLEAHLAPGSRVKLLDDGERILLALERGSVAASVVPVAGGEPFAVDVAGRRVAVHGTKLFISSPSASNGGAVQVAVSEGSAVVGASHGDGRTEGTLVPAGAVGSFGASPRVVRDASSATQLVDAGLEAGTETASATSPDAPGAMVAKALEPTPPEDALFPDPPTMPKIGDVVVKPPTTIAPPAVAGVVPSNSPGNAPGNSPTDGPVNPPATVLPKATTEVAPPIATPNTPLAPIPTGKGLEAAQVAPTMGKVLGSIRQCVPRTGAGVTFSITTKMTLSIAPSGAIDSVSFDDAPLDTKLAACVRAVAIKFSFPAATARTTITRGVVLGDKK